MTKKIISLLTISAFSITLLAQPFQFRGANRDGVYPDTDLLDEWPDGGPKLVGVIQGIGDGFGSPAINEQGLFVTGMVDSIGYLYHFNHSQELQWSLPYGREYTFKYTGARATPTLDGDLLYYSGTFGDAFCLNIKEKRFLWKKNIFQEFNGKEIKWGYAESPLIYEDLVILTPGGPEHNVVALDKLTGDLRWAADLDSTQNAYNSPVLIRHRGQDLILMNTTNYLLGIHPATGEVAFSHPIFHRQIMHAISPLYREGKVFYTIGYGVGSVLFEIIDEERGLDTLYHNPELDSRLSGLIEIGRIVFGTSAKKKQWVGVNLESGETVFTSREVKPGSFLLADNKFFIFTETGEVALAIPNEEGFQVKSRFTIPVQPTPFGFSHPVIDKGILYVRYKEHIWMHDVRK